MMFLHISSPGYRPQLYSLSFAAPEQLTDLLYKFQLKTLLHLQPAKSLELASKVQHLLTAPTAPLPCAELMAQQAPPKCPLLWPQCCSCGIERCSRYPRGSTARLDVVVNMGSHLSTSETLCVLSHCSTTFLSRCPSAHSVCICESKHESPSTPAACSGPLL